MGSSVQVGIDSQCLSYFIDAMASTTLPTDSLAPQKIALTRLFFYLPDTLWVTPTVTEECAQIRNAERASLHQSFISVLCGEKQLRNASEVKLRTSYLMQHHSGPNDCLILAEGEDVGHDVLLSFDSNFIRRLSPYSPKVELIRPKDYWNSLHIPHGVKPNKIPHSTNPLALQDWWRW